MKKELSNTILSEYDAKIDLYSSCKTNSFSLVKNILKNNNINYHSVQGRVRDRSKIKQKIARKKNKYNSLEEITDILGLSLTIF